MPLIYRAANQLEAQLVMDELRAAGIRTRMTGSYLSGAIGELPPTEVIGIWLDEPRHMERARDIIGDFEASSRSSGNDWQCAECGEWAGGGFGACWQCGCVRPPQ